MLSKSLFISIFLAILHKVIVRFFVFSALINVSNLVLAGDCLVSTTSKALMAHNSNLVEETLNRDTGQYAALLSNGDSVIASFGTCSLDLKAHYLSATKLQNDSLLKTATQFLFEVLPSDVVREYVLPKLKSVTAEDLNRGVVLDGQNDSHSLRVDAYPHDGVETIIHYRWIPPVH